MQRVTFKTVVDGAASAAMLVTSVCVLFFLWQNAQAKTASSPAVGPLPTTPVELAGSATEGSPDAPVGVVVFSDFECPFCRSFAQSVLPALRDEYIASGKVLVSFRHLPLKSHQFARVAAQAAVCANEQGRFWTLHDTFFAEPSSLREIDKTIHNIGGDTGLFATCRGSERVSDAVDADLELAKKLEIRATPTFLAGVNDHGKSIRVTTRFTGAASYESFKQHLGLVQNGSGR